MDFCERLFEIYDRKPYAILGADVVDATRTQHFNPVAEKQLYLELYAKADRIILDPGDELPDVQAAFGEEEWRRSVAEHWERREVESEAVAADSRVGEEREGVLLWMLLVFSREIFKVYGLGRHLYICRRGDFFYHSWRQRADCVDAVLRWRSSAFLKRL